MKNIYNDKEMPEKGNNISSGSFEFEDIEIMEETKQVPTEPPVAPQPQQNVQQFYQQPPYPQQPYQPVYVQGVPVPQLQLTPEQVAILLQQYAIPQQFVQPQQQTQKTETATDSGMRVLYQSEDFDKPVHIPEENYEEYEIEEVKPNKTPLTEEIEIEEEIISMPVRKSAPPKSTLKVEEMEMSTFELNSILSRQNRTQSAYAYKAQPAQSKSKDVPLNFGGGFSVEETADEVVTDISSDSKENSDGKKKKKLPTGEIIRRCVLGISLVAIVIASGMLINEYRLSKENDNLEEGISDLIISVPEETTKKQEQSGNSKDTTKKDNDEVTTTAPLTPEQQWAQIQAEYPNLIFPVGIQLKYAKLYATNQDFVGYLEAPGVNLSLPIVQTDNDSDYMEKNFYGKSTKYGCPFVTHLNNIVELDQNTVIFGHHMNNGTVFGALDAYKSIDGFKKAPVISFNTLYKDYSWKVIAAFITNAYEKDDNDYVFKYYFTSLSTQDRFAVFLNELSQRSLYDTGVDVLPTDKLLTLSTCSHEFTDARFVVVARLVRPGESTDVDVTNAAVNPNPRYPQAYYDKKKLDNPYINASRWEVG